MTTIFNVDAATQAWQPDTQRHPGKDFAHELAKHDGQTKPDSQETVSADPEVTLEQSSLDATAKFPTMALSLPTEEVGLTQAAQAIALVETGQLAQSTVTPTGVTETLLGARVFGWHAMAQAYLSELSTADGNVDKSPTAEEAVSAGTTEAEKVADEDVTSASKATLFADDVIAAPLSDTAVPKLARAALDEAPSSINTELATTGSNAAAYWSERSLRYVRQPGGGIIAWLRDFRLGDREAACLIQVVLDDAKARGMTLNKIMLNGREAWTSLNGIQGAHHDS
ncbi:hypothetical protein ISP15_17525 [Dyella jejuensis]|uniref:Uncharacterized protein n=1 Tax=Dyella jejuensis TaxID=1432009 RepID=A0ABW8JPD9_9GAMM